MNILFWGTPDYAVPTLMALHQAGHTLVGVVTQPDRRRGRGKTLIPSPVKAKALEMGLKVFTPQRIKQDESCQEQLAELKADLSVVVAFGQILPKSVLDQPPLGCWNGHGSLLPRWRGAGPIQWALLEGDAETGVGVMAMEEGLDTGPVLIERSLAIGLLDNGHTLAERMSALTADLMVEAMPLIALAGHGSEAERRARLKLSDQADRPGEASYARMLTKQDHQIDWSASALTIHRKVMALYPNAVTIWNDKRLKLLHCEPLIERLREELPTDTPPHRALGHRRASTRNRAGIREGSRYRRQHKWLSNLGSCGAARRQRAKRRRLASSTNKRSAQAIIWHVCVTSMRYRRYVLVLRVSCRRREEPPERRPRPPLRSSGGALRTVGSNPGTFSRRRDSPVRRSIAFKRSASSAATREMAWPVSPARPVRPMRCT